MYMYNTWRDMLYKKWAIPVQICTPFTRLLPSSHTKEVSLISIWSYPLKVPGPISQNWDIYSNDTLSNKKSWLQVSVQSVQPFGYKKRLRILQLLIPYCVNLIMVTIISHIFIKVFQTVHFSAVKFTRGTEKNMSFLLVPESHKVWKKSEAIGPGSFKSTGSSSKYPKALCKTLTRSSSNKCTLTVQLEPEGFSLISPTKLHRYCICSFTLLSLPN